MTVFLIVAPCSLAETNRRFRDAYCLHHQGIVTAGQSTPENIHLHTRQRKKSNRTTNLIKKHYTLHTFKINNLSFEGFSVFDKK
jgi:hypothetical protein